MSHRHPNLTDEELFELALVLNRFELITRRRLHLLECEVFRHHHRFRIVVYQETHMANGIQQGGQGTFAAQLLDNNNPIPLPAGATFNWSVDDSTSGVTVTASADSLSAVVAIPAGDTSATVTVTATTTAPDGNPASGSITVPVTAEAQKFTVSVTQVS